MRLIFDGDQAKGERWTEYLLTPDDLAEIEAERAAELPGAKARAFAAIDSLAARKIQATAAQYSTVEVGTWAQLEADAWRAVRHGQSPEAIVQRIASTPDITVEEYAKRILRHAIKRSTYTNAEISHRNTLKNLLDSVPMAAVPMIDFTQDWPSYNAKHISVEAIEAKITFTVKFLDLSTFYWMLTAPKVQELYVAAQTDVQISYLMAILNGASEIDRGADEYTKGIDYLVAGNYLNVDQGKYMKTSNDPALTINSFAGV